MKKAFYITKNLLFIKMETNDTFANNDQPKYMAASFGGLFPSHIHTEKEILDKWPDAEPGDNLQDLSKSWK